MPEIKPNGSLYSSQEPVNTSPPDIEKALRLGVKEGDYWHDHNAGCLWQFVRNEESFKWVDAKWGKEGQ